MEIGKPIEKINDITELLKPNDNDVYPLSVYYQP